MSDARKVILAYIAMYRTGDTACVADCVDAAYVDHTLPQFSGPDGVKRAVAAFHSLYKDISLHTEQLVVDGDRVAFLVRIEGTRAGQPRVLRIADFARVERGKLVELWTVQES